MPAITFQPVDNEYERGTYFNLKVLIMTRNGYFNATKLCQNEGKQFRFWLQNDHTKELFDKLERSDGIPSHLAMIKIGTGLNDYRGTYVHRKLITQVASWISVDIAFKVHDIVEEYLLKKEKRIIHEKNNEISRLKDVILRMESKNDIAFNDIKTTVTDLTDNISKLSLDNKITHDKLNKVQGTLEDRVVKPINKEMTNTVLIYEYDVNKFRIFRLQKRSAKAIIKRYLSENPSAVKFVEIDYNPNSINYFIRFKEQLKDNIKWHYNKFELLDITKDQLKEFIREINDKKYELKEVF